MKLKSAIIVNFQVEGVHYWKDCNIKEVDYLKNKHRHIFYVEICKDVKHNNRNIEIIMFKEKISEYLKDILKNPVPYSCEDIAEILVKKFSLKYAKVLEDNENGGMVYGK